VVHEEDSMKEKNGYVADELVVNYMQKKLRFERRRMSEELRGKELVKNKEYSSLKKRKTDVLDRIFRSMANLIFFFQCLAEHSELAEVFDNDIKDLLGIRRKDPQKQVLGFVFLELMLSIIKVKKQPLDEQNEKDFRLYLTHLLQTIIFDKVRLSTSDTFNNVHAQAIVEEDLMRAWAWTKMLADKVDLDIENDLLPHRTFNFGTNKLR
jgi:hypothetical protein